MRKIMFIPLLCLGLTACTPEVIYRDPPKIPQLEEKIKEDCPPLNLLNDKSIGTLATEDLLAVSEYTKCQEKQRALVSIYETVRLAREKYEEEKLANAKKK